jgi:condensin complex subunit 2
MPAPRKSAARKSEDAAPPRRAAAGAARRVVDSDSDDELAGGDDAYGEEDEGDTTMQSAPRRKAAAAPTPVETSSRTQMVPLQTKPRLPGGGVSALARSRMASSGAGTAGFARRGAPSSSDAAPHPSSSSAFTDTSTRSRGGVAALARANGPRRSLGASLHVQAGNASASHEAQAKEVQKLNVDSTSFEEWMKMATDNVSALLRSTSPVADTRRRKSTRATRGTLR